MAVIQRADEKQFVVRCYRETLSLKNTTLFKQHAFLISEMHGYFAKFLPGHGSKNIESVFSTDAGFLLAELAWYHLGKPTNMIYCEKLSPEEYICVIVRDGLIYTDGALGPLELQEELAAASIHISNAPIYIYGEVPGLVLPKNPETDPPLLQFNLKNITQLEHSLFNELEPSAEFELVPIQQAISDLQLSKASRRNIIGLIFLSVIFVVSIVIYYMISRSQSIEQIDPLENFRAALTTPSPQAELAEAAKMVLILNNIPGWKVAQVSIKGNVANATANSFGGSAQALLNWSIINNATVKFSSASATLGLALPPLSPRIPPTAPYPLQQILAKIIDATIALSLKKSIDIGTNVSQGAYSTNSITLHLQEASIKTLLLFGLFLNTLPITIDDIELDMSTTLMQGNISLTAYGS